MRRPAGRTWAPVWVAVAVVVLSTVTYAAVAGWRFGVANAPELSACSCGPDVGALLMAIITGALGGVGAALAVSAVFGAIGLAAFVLRRRGQPAGAEVVAGDERGEPQHEAWWVPMADESAETPEPAR